MADTIFETTPKWPAWFAVNKTTPAIHKDRVARGLHPMGLPLAGNGETCGSCANIVQNRCKYYKCRLHNTAGPATDIRMKWPACSEWKTPHDGPGSIGE